MNLIQESYQRLFPEKEFSYSTKMEYNRRLGDFNANIRLHKQTIQVNLNLQWKDIDNEIKIGLIQHLLLKVFKSKRNSNNIKLYNNFLKNIPLLTEITKSDPILEASFHRVNSQFFDGLMDQPNLIWGSDSRRKLACYNFHNDTISVSTLFKTTNSEILDFLMYHELLHKHHQFSHKNGRSSFHSKAFREDERRYPDFERVDKEISRIVKKKSFWSHFPDF